MCARTIRGRSAQSTIWACSIRQRRSGPYLPIEPFVIADRPARWRHRRSRASRSGSPRRRGILSRTKLGIRVKLVAGRVRLVGIGPLQPRAARAQRAVGEELGPDGAQAVAVHPAGGLRDCLEGVHARRQEIVEQIDHQPDLHATRVSSAAEGVPVVDGRAHRPAPVTPKPSRMSCALANASSRCASLGAGTALSISSRAMSTKSPLMMLPPAGA